MVMILIRSGRPDGVTEMEDIMSFFLIGSHIQVSNPSSMACLLCYWLLCNRHVVDQNEIRDFSM